MGIPTNLRDYSGTSYIKLDKSIVKLLSWDMNTSLEIEVFDVLDPEGKETVGKIIQIADKNIFDKLEKTQPKLKSKIEIKTEVME